MIYLILIISIMVNTSLLYYELGLGAFIAVLIQLSLITYFLYKKQKINFHFYIKAFLLILLVIPFIIRDMLVFKILTFMALPLIYSVFFIDFEDLNLIIYVPHIIDICFRPFAKIHLFFSELLNKLFKGREEVKYIIIGIAITIPFLFIIIPLLISSDLILQSMTLNLFDSFTFSSKFIFRIIFILLFSSYWYGQFNSNHKTIVFQEKTLMTRTTQSVYSTFTFLFLINIVYGLYVFIQIKYLFLNAGILPDNITYADYAREGFFQLVVVTIINFIIILLLENYNYNKLIKQRILESLTLFLTIIMAVSAFYRMSLYEQSYGYTTLRLLVFLFLIFLIVLMVLLIAFILSYNKFFLSSMSVFAVLVYISISWLNLDSYVAKSNIARFEKTGDIDIYYLYQLSDDAKSQHFYMEENYSNLIEEAYDNYDGYHLSDSEPSTTKKHWQEWNIYK